MFQAYHGHGDILRLLLPLFSNANIKDDTGKTPLDHASFKGTINLCPLVNRDWHKHLCVFHLILMFLPCIIKMYPTNNTLSPLQGPTC
jgi:hypothetical protein